MEASRRGTKPVVNPLPVATRVYKPGPSEVGQVARYLGLLQVEYLEDVADAKFLAAMQEVQDPQSCTIRKRPKTVSTSGGVAALGIWVSVYGSGFRQPRFEILFCHLRWQLARSAFDRLVRGGIGLRILALP